MVTRKTWTQCRWLVKILGLSLVIFLVLQLQVTKNGPQGGGGGGQGRIHHDVRHQSRVLLSTNHSKEDANCTPRASDNFPDDNIPLDVKRNGGVAFHIFIAIYAFGALAVVCNYYFLSAMEAICKRLGLSEDVAGATFMAIGTSAPEIGTAFIGVFITESNVGLDTVAGSTVFNMFFITSICGLFGLHIGNFTLPTVFFPKYCQAVLKIIHVTIRRWPVVRDLACFVVAAIVLIAVIMDGVVAWYEGLLVTLVYVAYIIIMIFSQRIQNGLDRCSERRGATDEETSTLLQTGQSTSKMYSDVVVETTFSGENQVAASASNSEKRRSSVSLSRSSGYTSSNELEGSLELSKSKFGHSVLSLGGDDSKPGYQSQLTWPTGRINQIVWILYLPISVLLFITIPDCNRPGRWKSLYLLTFFSSVVWVSGLSYVMVWMVEIIGEVFFIPESIMGITFLAVGTSIPDAIASLIACRRGYGDMAISNILGSNILDIVCTGLPWLIKTGIVEPGSLIVTGTASVVFTIISLLSSSVIVIIGFQVVRWTLDKRIGISYLIFYAVYLVISILYELNFFGLVNLPLCPD